MATTTDTESMLDTSKNLSEVSRGRVPPWAKFPSMPDILSFEPGETEHGYKRIPAEAKIDQMLEGAESWAESHGQEKVAKFLKRAEPCFQILWKVIVVLARLYHYLFRTLYYLYFWAPKQLTLLVFGGALCFFGGSYVATFAAVEAWRKLGWQQALTEVNYIYGEFTKVQKASVKDDDQDVDGDGIADVDQVSGSHLLKRKTLVAMQTVQDPGRLTKAVGALYTAYLAVLATLQLQFAKVIALALGIAEILQVGLGRLCIPFLAALLDTWGVKHWAKTILEVSVNLIAVFFAWYVQSIISAFYSGLRGGKIAGDAFVKLWTDFVVPRMPGFMPERLRKPIDPQTSYLDEIVCYTLFALGFGFQMSNFFAIPFPFNIVLLPVSMLEQFLRYQVTWS